MEKGKKNKSNLFQILAKMMQKCSNLQQIWKKLLGVSGGDLQIDENIYNSPKTIKYLQIPPFWQNSL